MTDKPDTEALAMISEWHSPAKEYVRQALERADLDMKAKLIDLISIRVCEQIDENTLVLMIQHGQLRTFDHWHSNVRTIYLDGRVLATFTMPELSVEDGCIKCRWHYTTPENFA